MREVCDFLIRSQGRREEVMRYVETARWPSPVKPAMKVVLKSGKNGGKS